MILFFIITISYVIFGRVAECAYEELSFPENFTIGAGGSSYQLEGAWNIDGKSENVWDRYSHSPGTIADGNNGDIACNAYFKYKEDVQFIKSIGLDFYRFSISWSRILPTGYTDVINEKGLQYYKNLTHELIANGIEPVVTIYHWDHPQILEEMGGWTNELMVDWFVAYARIIFEALGDSVKIWITINEPETFCTMGYSGDQGVFAPGKALKSVGKYLCGHNVLKAHAKTYRMYDEEFRATQQGEIGLAHACSAVLPANDSDTVTAETGFEFYCGWICHPIYRGDYSEVMKERVAMISKLKGYEQSILPEFSEEWITLIKGTADYFGLNHYRSVIVYPDPDEERGIYNTDSGLIATSDPSWPTPFTLWLYAYPPGFGYLLRQIRDKYNNPPLRVMENGYGDGGDVDDYVRIEYHHDYMYELITAVNRDGCNIKSYSIWSLMDNFEWNSGYMHKFGIISVDFNDPERTRTPKWSAYWWKSVITDRKLRPVPDNNESSNIISQEE